MIAVENERFKRTMIAQASRQSTSTLAKPTFQFSHQTGVSSERTPWFIMASLYKSNIEASLPGQAFYHQARKFHNSHLPACILRLTLFPMGGSIMAGLEQNQ